MIRRWVQVDEHLDLSDEEIELLLKAANLSAYFQRAHGVYAWIVFRNGH